MCAEVHVVPNSECISSTAGVQDPFTPPENALCLQWPKRDSNSCYGDFGGPVYAYETDKKGKLVQGTQEIICTLTLSPDVRPAATCLDAHVTFCTFIPGLKVASVLAWITAITNL